MPDPTPSPCQVVIAGASGGSVDPLPATIGPLLEHPPFTSADSITLAAASGEVARDPGGPVLRLSRYLADQGRAVHIVTPSSFRRTKEWKTVVLPSSIGRLSSVQATRALVDAETLILVNQLPVPIDLSSPVIGVWPRFVPLLLRLGALASGAREGMTAEIAFAFKPSLIVMTGIVRGIMLVVATTDQVAAELIGIACATVVLDVHDPETAVGPWEFPLVQRATELGLGVALPSEIAVHFQWFGGVAAERVVFGGLIADITSALGIPAHLIAEVP